MFFNVRAHRAHLKENFKNKEHRAQLVPCLTVRLYHHLRRSPRSVHGRSLSASASGTMLGGGGRGGLRGEQVTRGTCHVEVTVSGR